MPPSGPGADNGYEVYGNFFYQNPTEALFQAEGNVALYANLMVSSTGSAVNVQPHNGSVRSVRIFGNTIVAAVRGISVSANPAYTQQVLGNAIFAATPMTATNASGNVTDTYANAASYLTNPFGAIGSLDLFPKVGTLRGAVLDTTSASALTDWSLDFNGKTRDWSFRGAYSGEGNNPGWLPTMAAKPR